MIVLLTLAAQAGVAVGLHPPEAKRLGIDVVPDMAEIRSLGADAILLPVPWSTRDTTSVGIRPNAETIADADLVRAIRAAHQHGLQTTLMPYVVLVDGAPGDWRGKLRPADPDAWWHAYERLVSHYAQIAEREGVRTLVVGSELSSMQPKLGRWRGLIGRVRSTFGGELAYVANHDALTDAPFDLVDVAGVSAYWSLTDDLDASAEALESAWRRIAADLDREVVLFEVGYPSIDGAAIAPWDDTIGAPIDLEEQRRAYTAATKAIASSPNIRGAYFWGWFGPGGPYDRSYTPRGKPAELVLRRFFASRSLRRWPHSSPGTPGSTSRTARRAVTAPGSP